MAISTLAELKTTIADFLNRSDLTSVVPTFIDLAESQINRDVRHWRMENRAATTLTSQYLTRPTDWVQTQRIRINGGKDNLELLSSAAMDERRAYADNITGVPDGFRHIEDQFEFFPSPNANLPCELVYLQKIPALTDSNTTNWLLTYAPDIYLYGSLLHTAPYLAEDPRIAVWAQLYSAAVQRLNEESEQADESVSGLRMRRRGLNTGSTRYN